MHLITTRTVEAALWMVPTQDLVNEIGGVIARYQEIFCVEIYAFAVLGNHYHMLVRAPEGHLDEFAENVNREIAKRVNRRHGRRGRFWERRYDDQVVLSKDDALEALVYIATNPVKHSLSAHPREYPGLLCYQQLLDGKPQRFEFIHYAKSSMGAEVRTSHALVLSPVPGLDVMGSKERRKMLLQRIQSRVDSLRKEIPRFATASTLRKQTPGAIPKSVSRSPRPLAYSKDPALIREHKESARHLCLCYAHASARYRAGEANVVFPPHTFKPPLHRAPRVVPFGHLTKLAA